MRIRNIFTVLMLCICTGCLQLTRFSGEFYKHGDHPYYLTRGVWDLVCAPVKLHSDDVHGEDKISYAYATLFWPLIAIDFPLEVACDTVMCVPDLMLKEKK